MDRDIVLGVLSSLILHGLVLWQGTHIQGETSSPRPFPVSLHLSIIRTSTHRENLDRKGPIQKVPRSVPSPMPVPLRSRPEFAKMTEIVRRTAPVQKVKRTLRATKAGEVIRKKPLSELIPALEPTWSAKAIPEEIEISKQVSEKRKIAQTIPKQRSIPDAGVPFSRISSPAGRIADNRKPPPPEGRKTTAAAIGETFGKPSKPSRRGDSGSGIRQEAYVPGRESPQIIEATPDYAINPKPVYPRLAIRRNYEGTVTLLVEVLGDGSVREIEIFESSGHKMLDRSALKAVRKWRFKPGTKGGKPVTMKVKVPVVFRLTRDVRG